MDKDLQHILELCTYDTSMVAKTFFPERFEAAFAPQIHGEIFKLIDGPYKQVAIAAPRGWGKTSTVALGLTARYILFGLADFIIYINKSHDAASLQTENLRRELVVNRSIKHFFGDFKSRGTTSAAVKAYADSVAGAGFTAATITGQTDDTTPATTATAVLAQGGSFNIR